MTILKELRALGVRLGWLPGEEGSALRLLAEMPWYPTSLFDTRSVTWSAIDVDHARATLQLFGAWQTAIMRPGFDASARNLACYLALRQHELPSLQLALMRWGLSSLGRSESHVEATLDAVIATLGAMCGRKPGTLPEYPPEEAVFMGTRVIARESDLLFGSTRSLRRTRIMVTLPAEAAEDLPWMQRLVQSGVDCVRINCAHDTPEVWSGMLSNLRIAQRELGSHESVRVLMDLGGPKVRTVRQRRACQRARRSRTQPWQTAPNA